MAVIARYSLVAATGPFLKRTLTVLMFRASPSDHRRTAIVPVAKVAGRRPGQARGLAAIRDVPDTTSHQTSRRDHTCRPSRSDQDPGQEEGAATAHPRGWRWPSLLSLRLSGRCGARRGRATATSFPITVNAWKAAWYGPNWWMNPCVD